MKTTRALRAGLAQIEAGKAFEDLLPSEQLALFQEYQALWWKHIGSRRHQLRRLRRQAKRQERR